VIKENVLVKVEGVCVSIYRGKKWVVTIMYKLDHEESDDYLSTNFTIHVAWMWTLKVFEP
jgi:hypothetical protein